MLAPAEQPVFIPGPAGRLEAAWAAQAEADGRAAVICHPHPLQGGNMNNKVVTTLARVWRDRGVSTLRFNFRGVGASEGLHGRGIGEIDDLLAALQWLRSEQGLQRVSLAGFSFGAWIAAATTPRLPPTLQLERLVLVAPPVQYEGFADLQLPPGTLVLQGEADEVVEPEAVYAWASSRRPAPEVVRFPETGHFFHGRLTALKAELAARLPPP